MKRKINIYVPFISLLTFVLWSCSSSMQPKSKNVGERVFSVKDVVLEQRMVLEKLNPKVNRKVSYNGKQDEKVISDVDWKKELEIISQFDLNNIKWAGQFTCDTTYEDSLMIQNFVGSNQSELTHYRVVHDALDRIKLLEIKTKTSGQVTSGNLDIIMQFGLYENTFPLLTSFTYESNTNVSHWQTDSLIINSKIEQI